MWSSAHLWSYDSTTIKSLPLLQVFLSRLDSNVEGKDPWRRRDLPALSPLAGLEASVDGYGCRICFFGCEVCATAGACFLFFKTCWNRFWANGFPWVMPHRSMTSFKPIPTPFLWVRLRSFGPKVLTHAKQGCAKMTGVSRLESKSESKMLRLDFSIAHLSFYYMFSLKSEDLL
jgi:hypothetical protein